MTQRWDRAAVTAVAVDDVVSVHEIGVTRAVRRAEIAAGRWQQRGAHALVLHNGPMTRSQQMRVALIEGGPTAALSGPTAAMLEGMSLDHLRVDGKDALHVTVPIWHRRPVGLDVVTHWSSQLGDADVHTTRDPRRTRIARSVVDTASWQLNERAARAVVLSAVQQRLTTPDLLEDALSRRANCKHRAIIQESIDDARGGAHSLPEVDFKQIVVANHLPTPLTQVVRLRPSGRAYLDVDWPQYRLSAEIEGVQHFDAEHREQDLDRLADLVIEGDRVLMLSSYAVRRRKEHVASILRRGLTTGGWVPQR